jgi:hypothetical protein
MELKQRNIPIMTDMEKTVLRLTPDEGRSILYEDHEDFELVTSEIVDNTRWSIVYEDVYQRLSDKKFFKTTYRKGATEYQDERPYEYLTEAVFEEVFPVEKLVTVYE